MTRRNTVILTAENIDATIGRLLRRLESMKICDNTIVIFLTDNGPDFRRYNAGLRACKGSVYEGGIRAPFYVRWPRRLAGGGKVNIPAAHIDVLPTILEACRMSGNCQRNRRCETCEPIPCACPETSSH